MDCMVYVAAIAKLTAERDSLKEQLRKAQEENSIIEKNIQIEQNAYKEAKFLINDYEREISNTKGQLQKAESDKAVAVRIAVEYIRNKCERCNDDFKGTCPKLCDEKLYKKQLESLTGQKFEEMSR